MSNSVSTVADKLLFDALSKETKAAIFRLVSSGFFVAPEEQGEYTEAEVREAYEEGYEDAKHDMMYEIQNLYLGSFRDLKSLT